jgi:hypothetical protein
VSTVLQIADAVAASLNAHSFSPGVNAERHYQPSFDLDEMKDLQVTVVPKSWTGTPASRDSEFSDYAIDIGVQQRVNVEESVTVLDALMTLVERIHDHLRMKTLDGMPGAMWVGATNEPIFAPENLMEKHVLTSVLTVRYRVRR